MGLEKLDKAWLTFDILPLSQKLDNTRSTYIKPFQAVHPKANMKKGEKVSGKGFKPFQAFNSM